MTNPIPYDADSSTVKEELEALSTIARVHVERTPLDIVGGCTWSVSFLEDGSRAHRGDMPLLVIGSSLIGTPDGSISIVVAEERKGTVKEVQTITVDGGGNNVDPTSSFRLRFEGEETGDILALPLGGNTCLGSTKAKQIITTSTVDTSDVGGDDSVSHLTSFALSYKGYITPKIMANGASCDDTSAIIAQELMQLPPLYEVSVSGSDTGIGDEGCLWVVTFLSAMGNPELMTVTAYNGDLSVGPRHSVTVGDAYSIIRDTIAVSQPEGFEGDVNLIQSELSKLRTIGIVTVSPMSAIPDVFGQCTWNVTFESKAGDISPLEVARSGTSDFSTVAELNSGNRVIVTDDIVRGTSSPVSGDFRLEFDGELTGYIPHNASPELVESTLDSLHNVGDVSVARFGPDVNGCYSWEVTFVSDLGPLPRLVVDDLDLTGSVPSISVSKVIEGTLPPFNGEDYGHAIVQATRDLSVLIQELKQGIPFYVRISALNALGASPSIMPYPPYEIPFPQPPAPPSGVILTQKDGSTLAVAIDAPFHDGGDDVISYRVDYSMHPFIQERQRISLTCDPQPAIQSVTTSAMDINEIQYLVIDSSYNGAGRISEVQNVRCDASGGTFSLSLGGETAYISHDADYQSIKESLQSLSAINEVSIAFNNGRDTACAPFDGLSTGDFSVTFLSLSGMDGDLPQMTAESSGLEGARHVVVTTEVDGDAPLSGSIRLAFRGSMSREVDVSLEPYELAAAINSALEELDTIQEDGVTVEAVNLVHGGHEKIFRIEFQGSGVGGNVESVLVVPEYILVVGSSADAFVLSDGESYAARNGLDSVTSAMGNELSGYFRLRLRGHTTRRISFNASVDEMKAGLEELPNIGQVDVQVIGPTKEMAFTWVITFLSSPGYFPPSARNIDDLAAVNELSSSAVSDTSAMISVETIQVGDSMLDGQFQVSYNDGVKTETTRALQSFISAEELERELEALSNIGRVTVVRSRSLVGYEWDIEFTSCGLKNGHEICNDGNLLPLKVSDVNLQGCGGPTLEVLELTAGSGPDSCPQSRTGLCSDEESFAGQYPIHHEITGLILGTPYYVQVRLRNSQSYGHRRLSNPFHVTPQHNPPGSPPPVFLRESTSTSITVEWEKPRVNGGKEVSGYELWMDTWSGGEFFMVYDGAGSPDVMEFRIATNDIGPHSQIVETGRQYRFKVRALNNCDTEDLSRSCFGEFSEMQAFTVREPRAPLPPSMPERDSNTRVHSSIEATISVSWLPPVDNGGSPVNSYFLYMKDYNGVMTTYMLDHETTRWQVDSLRPGQLYRFHVVALNAFGKSGNSPVLTTIAAMNPGLSYAGVPEFAQPYYRPSVTTVRERSMKVKWLHPHADITGGSPIIGFKLYMYKFDNPLLRSNADQIKGEVQNIIISSDKDSALGTFTVSFLGYQTTDIAVDATANMVKNALENLPSINLVHVDLISNGWSVTFLSEAGDLPLMQVTSGRLSSGTKIVTMETTKGDIATLIYDGSETPGQRTFEVNDLAPNSGYAFKVAPVNAVGDGTLSFASVVTIATAGASASKTTASGSALSKGIAGSIQEVQIVTFLSSDCSFDSLKLSYESSTSSINLCGATADVFETEIEGLGAGNVHVSREEASSFDGHSGYSWTVTFNSRFGDIPMLTVDYLQVGNGRDALGRLGLNGLYVVEFLKGQSNEFLIEPKTASGSVVQDFSTSEGMEGKDIFFTELWTSDASIVDGSHSWYSNGGVSTYNPVLYIEQMVAIPLDIGAFYLSMDTSETQPLGRIDGIFAQTRDITDVSAASIQTALAELSNVGQVHVTQRNNDDDGFMYFVVTFREVFGEYPLLAASEPSIAISRNNGHLSSTETQTIRLSVDKPFTYEIQTISISSDKSSFDLAFKAGPRTNPIPCNFQSMAEASEAARLVEVELNSLSSLKVRVDNAVSGAGTEDDPWMFRVTFREPVGPLPLLQSDNAFISQELQGDSSLIGSLVLSYEGEYTGDIPYDASAKIIKDNLEVLTTINGVNVQKVDLHIGYQWVISFTGHAGNLPLLVAHNNVFEIQLIEIRGGNPTPIGGAFTLSYLAEETGMLPFDSSADMIKSSLESLRSIDHVDVTREMFEHGEFRWLVTFRVPHEPVVLGIDGSRITGSVDSISVFVEKDAQSPSLLAKVGSSPTIIVEEKVPGLPSYTGQYRALTAGDYSLAVLQLESGGLNAQYFDNQWFMEEPVIQRVDPTVSFNWGSGVITVYGRDYVSIRWWGKIKPLTSEPYTFFLSADDGARLYIDHVLVIDLWEQPSLKTKATVELSAGSFHDLKVEYKEITGDARLLLEWSSRSLQKQVINPSQLYHPSHIVGSPFQTSVISGAADYPYSEIIEVAGRNLTLATAGERTSFLIQARDSTGNLKLFSGDAAEVLQIAEEQFVIDIIGDHGSISGDITYLETGHHRVDYTVLKAGTYRVHVMTGDTDIYCGLGEENKCSPFSLTVLPGATLASNCEVESTFDPVDYLVEARAGEIGTVYLQSKDAFGNNRISGGDEVVALFKSATNPDIQYRGNVKDRGDGSYQITYSIPIAGSYLVSITVADEAVKYCVSPSGERWDSRQYDGASVYSPPSFCSLNDDLLLHVIHRELHAASSTLAEDNLLGLSAAVVGEETGFSIESRDKFGNVRFGSSTSNIVESGDGTSDAFLVSLVGSGNSVVSSSAVETLSCLDSSVQGYFRLSYGGKETGDIPHNMSAAAMQVLLSSLHNMGSNQSTVLVHRSDVNGNFQWKITFIDHLELWSEYPLAVLTDSGGSSSVSDKMIVTKLSRAGIYPVRYTIWETGTYELRVFSGNSLVSGSSYTIEVANGTPQASSSYAAGLGLESGVAGDASSFEVTVRDRRQSEIQSIITSATVIDFIHEVQRVKLMSNVGDTFRLEFRGQQTVDLEIGLSSLSDLTDALESLPSIENVAVTSDGSDVIQNGDSIDVEFVTEHGKLDLMKSSGLEEITRLIEGEAPNRPERQVLHCRSSSGYFILSFKDVTTTIEFDDEFDIVASKLSAMIGRTVWIVDPDDSVATICSTAGKFVFIDFPAELGNVEPIGVSFVALDDGSISIMGNGEEDTGAVNGISPIMGHFTLSLEGETTALISVTATAGEMEIALEDLVSIGSVSVTKDLFGSHENTDGVSLFSIWSITFAPEENELGCEPGSWDKCPANIGDVPPLVIDSTSIEYIVGATQLQPAPIIRNFEVKKGSAGNTFNDNAGPSNLDFSLSHNLMQGVGIEMHEVHTLACSYSPEALVAADPTGSFELGVLNTRILIDAQASLHKLSVMLSQALGLKHPVSTSGSTHETVCHFNRSNPAKAVTKLIFSKVDGPLPNLFVYSEQSVQVRASNDVDAVDKVDYLGFGRHLITYTPIISGHYSVSIQLEGNPVWTDLSSGVLIYPSRASAHSCSHDSTLVAVAGTEESFHVTARDRFGNKLSSAESNVTSLQVSLEGVADQCNNATRRDKLIASTDVVNMGNSVGHYKIVYTPTLSGVYTTSVVLRSQGGLLATYFKNQDFSEPVLGNNNHNLPPYHETPWCAADKSTCDSTRLDLEVAFEWGFDAPIGLDSFPMDSFSVVWEGELKVKATDTYTFTVYLNGEIRLTIGKKVIIDSLVNTNAASVISNPVLLEANAFHPIRVEYVHTLDEAIIQLFWEASSVPKQIVPSSALYYSRHVGGSPPSPFPVHVVPGDIDAPSTAFGFGLTACIAMEECSFDIQTKDLNQNIRFHDGSDPGFEIDIIGIGGWAGEGRINGVLSSNPVTVAEITVASTDWQPIGDAFATHLSTQLFTSSSFVGMVSRGDTIAVDGSLYTISPSGTFDPTNIPLLTPYLGPTKDTPVFKASKSCASGTHTVKYTPLVRGSYQMDVRLPSFAEIQRVTTTALSHSSLSGAFTLAFLEDKAAVPLISGSIDYDATAEKLKIALESIESIGSVAVTQHNCDDPEISCSWYITFSSLDGDVHLLLPNKDHLGGMSDIRVEAVTDGRRPKSISGFPRTVSVSPGPTSPSRTVALGRGITSATAGQKSVFVIQPKDSYGNDRLAEQEIDLFAVYIYPEQGKEDGSYPVTKGIIHREENGKEGIYTVEYTPESSGFHTISVVHATSTTKQIITTSYTSKARGGTFSLRLGNLLTLPVPWDADSDALKSVLDSSMGGLSLFSVQKQAHGLLNFKYTVSFETLLGNVPNFSVDTSNLLGNANEWDVTTLREGHFSHIAMHSPKYEIQLIKLKILDQSSLTEATFGLQFMGLTTDSIDWDADAKGFAQKLQKLSTVGDILVSLDVDEVSSERVWRVTFNPYEGSSPNSLINFGNLASIVVTNMDSSIFVVAETEEDGTSPFRIFVSPAEPSPKTTTVYDYQGMLNFEGLSTGVYKSDSHFFVQSRDEFSNEILDGPLNEIQIIETSSTSQIGGLFEVSIFGTTVRVHASAFTSELEKILRSIPGVGSVSVSSNSAKDLVPGKTVAVTKGLNTLVPSEQLAEFIVGDWIRIGDRDEGLLFSITDMADVAPFTVTLSSSFLGQSSESSTIYQHGSSRNRKGYQYIVSFDAVLGDIPPVRLDGSLLEGDDAKVEVTACDRNVHQRIQIHSTSSSPVDGYFYLAYGSAKTRALSVGMSASELENAILSDIISIHSLSVTATHNNALGSYAWTFYLKSFDDDAQLFFAEGHLLVEGTIIVAPTCPIASENRLESRVESVAGRRGGSFIVTLDGPTAVVHGGVRHIENGLYLATYRTPEVGKYSLSIQTVRSGGIFGEYFNNRWLYGSPTLSRVDLSLDFHWGNIDFVTPTARDFVSVRWTGYIRPVFNEVYTFTSHVNDALRLWVGDELLIDEFENEVDDIEEYAEISATTTSALNADQLVAIKIEYRENRGTALFRLYWKSISQPLSIIDQPRLFFNASHIPGSPFEVTPLAIKPSRPTSCNVDIVGSDSLRVTWSVPDDDGGSAVNKYLVESWDANEYGTTEKQQLRIDRTITGGSFSISMHSHSATLPIGSSALDFELLVESLPGVGDVNVTKLVEATEVVYDVEFLTHNSPVPIMKIDIIGLTPENIGGEYCVCAKSSTNCAPSGSPNMSCESGSTREGTISTRTQEVPMDLTASNTGDRFSHIIQGLNQPSNILVGFGVRVSAGNSVGFSNPCPPLFLKPFSPPLPPTVVELRRVASDPSSLAVHFTSVTNPEDKGSIVSAYFIEWSTSEGFEPGSVANVTLSAKSIHSTRLSSYNEVNKVFNYHSIEGLTSGIEYFVRVAAVNKAGMGPKSFSSPPSLAPGFKPTDIEDQSGVHVATLLPDSMISIAESSSTLRVSWRAPFSDNGFGISNYLIESWVSNGVYEVQELNLLSPNGSQVRGTFALSYGGETTDSLSVDSTAETLKSALESLRTIREVRVWRSGSNPEYKWTITFVSEYPSISGHGLSLDESSEIADSSGDAPTMLISVLTRGVLPVGYSTKVVAVDDALQTHYHCMLTNLTAGQFYSVQVSAANKLGYGRPQTSIPNKLAPPVQKPSNPTNVLLSVSSSHSLEVIFTSSDSDGGETITLYRIEWDTEPDFDSVKSSPLGSYSFTPPQNGAGCGPCKHQITGLTKGQEYYVRVYAYNSHGYSVEPGIPTPHRLSPKTTPDPPRFVHLIPQSDTEIQVSFPPTDDDGGAPVTKYKIEWNTMSFFARMQSVNSDHTALLYSPFNVQSITLSAEGPVVGGFRIAFGGHATEEVAATATPNDLKIALESLPTVGSVSVSRDSYSNVIIWIITFRVNLSNVDTFGPIELLSVSADPSALPFMFGTNILGVSGSSISGTDVRLEVKEEVTAYKGFEQQTLTTQCESSLGVLGGTFALSFEGSRTNEIPFNVSASDLTLNIETIPFIGSVKAVRRKIIGSKNSFQWTIIFLDRLGNVPLFEVHNRLTCSDGSGAARIFVTETVQGVLPRMDGPYSGRVELNATAYADGRDILHSVGGLLRGMTYHFRVSAWNGAERSYGNHQYSIPSLMAPMGNPDPPSTVEMSSIDDSTIYISWDCSLARGGVHQIIEFMIELEAGFESISNVTIFSVKHLPEVQEIILETTANDMGGHIRVHFMGEVTSNISIDANEVAIKHALEGISTIDQVQVSIIPHTQDFMSSYGQRWIITFSSQRGNLPSMLVDTGSGLPSTIATGGSLRGSSSVVRVRTIFDGGLPTSFTTPSILSSQKKYRARVMSFNGHRWSVPAISQYSITPSKGPPTPPLKVRVNVLSDTKLGVSWTQPIYSGGDPIAMYRIEWDTDSLFDQFSSTVSHINGTEEYYFVVKNLDPSESYFVRVMAYSAMGFSEPVLAVPLLSGTQVVAISLIEETGTVDYSETFAIVYMKGNGFQWKTDPISVYATAKVVEDELNRFAHVSVDREDHSLAFDTSGSATNFFSILYRVTFFGEVGDVVLSIIDDNLGSISVAVEP